MQAMTSVSRFTDEQTSANDDSLVEAVEESFFTQVLCVASQNIEKRRVLDRKSKEQDTYAACGDILGFTEEASNRECRT